MSRRCISRINLLHWGIRKTPSAPMCNMSNTFGFLIFHANLLLFISHLPHTLLPGSTQLESDASHQRRPRIIFGRSFLFFFVLDIPNEAFPLFELVDKCTLSHFRHQPIITRHRTRYLFAFLDFTLFIVRLDVTLHHWIQFPWTTDHFFYHNEKLSKILSLKRLTKIVDKKFPS